MNMRRILSMIIVMMLLPITSFAYIEEPVEDNSNYILNMNFDSADAMEMVSNNFSIVNQRGGSEVGKVNLAVENGTLKMTRTDDGSSEAGIEYKLGEKITDKTVKLSYRVKVNDATVFKLYVDGVYVSAMLNKGHSVGGFLMNTTTANNIYSFFDPGRKAFGRGEFAQFEMIFDVKNKTMRLFVNGVEAGYYKENGKDLFNDGKSVPVGFNGIENIRLVYKSDLSPVYLDDIKISVEKDKSEEQMSYDTEYKIKKSALKYLEIYDEKTSDLPMESEVTREQFLTIALKLLKTPEKVSSKIEFSDVKSESDFYNYPGYAAEKGYISYGDGNFRPKDKIKLDEAMKIIVNILGYSDMAEASGGYPHGYYALDISKDLLEGITVKSGEQTVNLKDFVILVYNSLDIEVPTLKITSDGKFIDFQDTETFLNRYFGLEEKTGIINEVNYANKTVAFSDKNGENSVIYETTGVSLLNISGTYRTVWIDNEDTVVYMTPYKNSQVIYGYVQDLNKGKGIENVKASNVNSLLLSVYDEYIDTSDKFEIISETVSNTYDLTGAFVKAITYNGEIEKIEILADELTDISEGGIITKISEDEIDYKKGNNRYMKQDNFDAYKEVITVINGREASFTNLLTDMLFDYFEYDGYLYIIASDKKAEGDLKSVSDEYIKIGDIEFDLSKRSLYISSDSGATYDADISLLKKMMNENVSVYIDIKNCVRYIAGGVSGEFFGIVRNGYLDESDEEPRLRVYMIEGDKISDKTYIYKNKKTNIYYPEVSFEAAALNGNDFNANGVYKFTVKGDKITKIEELQWRDNKAKLSMTGFTSSTYRRFATSSSVYYYDKMISLTDELGEFNPQVVSFNDVKNKISTGAIVMLEGTMPISELAVVVDAYDYFYSNTSQVALVKKKSVVSQDDDIYYRYTLCQSGSENIVDVLADRDFKYNGKNAEVGDIIIYKTVNMKKHDNQMVVDFIFKADDINWESTNQQSNIKSGDHTWFVKSLGRLYDIEKNFLKTYNDTGAVYNMITSGCVTYKISGNKIENCTVEEAVGKNIFVCGRQTDLIQLILVLDE